VSDSSTLNAANEVTAAMRWVRLVPFTAVGSYA
jgi:hypothetical protein